MSDDYYVIDPTEEEKESERKVTLGELFSGIGEKTFESGYTRPPGTFIGEPAVTVDVGASIGSPDSLGVRLDEKLVVNISFDKAYELYLNNKYGIRLQFDVKPKFITRVFLKLMGIKWILNGDGAYMVA